MPLRLRSDQLSPRSLGSFPVLNDHSRRQQCAGFEYSYRVRQKEKLQISEEKVAELTQQLRSVKLEQQTLAQRNVMLERLLSMQQAVATQTPDATGGRAAIEVQKDAWWLDSEMKVPSCLLSAFCLHHVFTVYRMPP